MNIAALININAAVTRLIVIALIAALIGFALSRWRTWAGVAFLVLIVLLHWIFITGFDKPELAGVIRKEHGAIGVARMRLAMKAMPFATLLGVVIGWDRRRRRYLANPT